ncbi:MAG: 16S rRNA processing protein RimM [Deltaproteobacteria bacterium]|nr:MAG: 16S rRNA processing protein RimM [Deltaproteobacteria bacterium]
MKLLLMGVIGKPHGLHGGCFVRPFNPDSPLWREGAAFELVPADRVPTSEADTIDGPGVRQLTVEAVGLGPKDRLLCMFQEIVGREAIDALRGHYLAVPLESLPAADDDEFFFHEVKGWAVVDPSGAPLGTVSRVVETYAELLEVRPTHGGAPVLVPVVAALVTEIDRAGQRIVVDPPEGMFP